MCYKIDTTLLLLAYSATDESKRNNRPPKWVFGRCWVISSLEQKRQVAWFPLAASPIKKAPWLVVCSFEWLLGFRRAFTWFNTVHIPFPTTSCTFHSNPASRFHVNPCLPPSPLYPASTSLQDPLISLITLRYPENTRASIIQKRFVLQFLCYFLLKGHRALTPKPKLIIISTIHSMKRCGWKGYSNNNRSQEWSDLWCFELVMRGSTACESKPI